MSAVREVSGLRVPPHSIDGEQAVLGGLMLDPSKLDRVTYRLSEQDFYRRDHQLIFRAMCEVDARGTPCDAVTLGEFFEANGLSDQVGGTRYVLELANSTPSAANIMAYAALVAKKSRLRRLIDAGTQMIGAAFDAGDQDADAIIDRVLGDLMQMQGVNRNTEMTLAQAMQAAYRKVEATYNAGGKLPGITTGLAALDEFTGGLQDDDLMVVGARSAMGKTSLMWSMIEAAGGAGVSVGVISGEQPSIQLGMRALSHGSGVPGSALRRGQIEDGEWHELTHALAKRHAAPVIIDDAPSPRVENIARMARRWKRERGIKVLFVDYIQRCGASGQNRIEVVSNIARGLKSIARELHIPVVALSQVKRDVDDRNDKRPRAADLSDSSDIEKEADQVVLIYRDEHYHRSSKWKGTAELIIDKNRHGETGYCRVAWLGKSTRFADLADDYEPLPDAEEPAAEPKPAHERKPSRAAAKRAQRADTDSHAYAAKGAAAA